MLPLCVLHQPTLLTDGAAAVCATPTYRYVSTAGNKLGPQARAIAAMMAHNATVHTKDTDLRHALESGGFRYSGLAVLSLPPKPQEPKRDQRDATLPRIRGASAPEAMRPRDLIVRQPLPPAGRAPAAAAPAESEPAPASDAFFTELPPTS
jgi:hypothetical protein